MTEISGNRRYLLVPMQPTPNGRLHLGHASGPYLRADVLARALRRSGHHVELISGSDVYENWVLLDALRNQRSPLDTCNRFHRLIQADLRNLEVAADAYVNPLDPALSQAYTEVHEEIVDQLIAGGNAELVRESFPVSTHSGRYVVGVWLLGRCPNCGADAAGNSCEDCGYHFQPSEILEPRSRLDEGPLTWRQQDCWFMVPRSTAAVLEAIEQCGAPPDMVKVASRYVEQTGSRIRLTIPSSWGIKGRHCSADTVLCNTYYAYTVFCGGLYGGPEAQTPNAFSRSSDVTTVGLFGIDNTIAGLVGTSATALCHGGLKSFDHVCVNYFLNLEGRKFSTSKGHVIWLSDLIEQTSISADEVRYYLAHICPEEAEANFSVQEFIETTNRLRSLLAELVQPALARLDGAPAPEDGVLRLLERALERQAERLLPERLRLAAAVKEVDDWLAHGAAAAREPARAFWWLRGLALLAEPFMPDLAGRLWAALGGSSRPVLARLAERGRPRGAPRLEISGPLREAEIDPHVLLADQRSQA